MLGEWLIAAIQSTLQISFIQPTQIEIALINDKLTTVVVYE